MKSYKVLLATTAIIGLSIVTIGPAAHATVVGQDSTGIEFGYESDHDKPVPDTGESLKLKYVPRTFNFNSNNKVTSAAQTYGLISSTGKQYLSLSDSRRKDTGTTGLSWKITATASKLEDTSNSSSSLSTSANYSINTSSVILPQGDSDPASYSPKTDGANALVTGQNTAVLPADGTTSTEVLRSANGSDSDGDFGAEVKNVSLNIPAGAAGTAGSQYAGTITWELNDTI